MSPFMEGLMFYTGVFIWMFIFCVLLVAVMSVILICYANRIAEREVKQLEEELR